MIEFSHGLVGATLITSQLHATHLASHAAGLRSVPILNDLKKKIHEVFPQIFGDLFWFITMISLDNVA